MIYAGANVAQSAPAIATALKRISRCDLLLLQNETDMQENAARRAHDAGAQVIYSAAPFDVEAVRKVLPFVSVLMMNAVESGQLCAALETKLENLPVPGVVVTRGASGAEWIAPQTGERLMVPAFPVTPVDTTGAGDTFAGYFAAGLDEGMPVADALRLGAGAAALKITRPGTSRAIPSRPEVDRLLASG